MSIHIKVIWNKVIIQYESCWYEEEPCWFWVMGSNVKVNFVTLCIRSCGHHIKSNFTCNLWTWGGPYWFWVTGSKVKFKLWSKLWLMRGGTLFILGHRVKSQGNFVILCIRPCEQDTDYNFCPITFKFQMLVLDDKRKNPTVNGSGVKG